MDCDSTRSRQGGVQPREIVHRSYHDPTGETDLSTSVLLALDSLPGYDLHGGDESLFDRLDPDALDALFEPAAASRRAEGQVTFTIDSYEVTACANGEITIRSLA